MKTRRRKRKRGSKMRWWWRRRRSKKRRREDILKLHSVTETMSYIKSGLSFREFSRSDSTDDGSLGIPSQRWL